MGRPLLIRPTPKVNGAPHSPVRPCCSLVSAPHTAPFWFLRGQNLSRWLALALVSCRPHRIYDCCFVVAFAGNNSHCPTKYDLLMLVAGHQPKSMDSCARRYTLCDLWSARRNKIVSILSGSVSYLRAGSTGNRFDLSDSHNVGPC